MKNYIWYDVKSAPFGVHGLIEENGRLVRMPYEIAETVNDGVAWHSKVPAGGRVRFKTDSDKIAIRAKLENAGPAFFAPPMLMFGFDLYRDFESESVFLGTAKPAYDKRDDFEFEFSLSKGEKDLALYLPCHSYLVSLEIGILPESSIGAHRAYRFEKPIVYYGSSITQGLCASRPGKAYQAQISRMLDSEYINLGFSGSCRGEEQIARYIAELEMLAFVCDYDHNVNAEILNQNHYRFYEIFREKQPNTPYFMVSRPDYTYGEWNAACRTEIMRSFVRARDTGDKNVYFIDGAAFFLGRELLDCTVDGIHPNDDGFTLMAASIGDTLKKTLEMY